MKFQEKRFPTLITVITVVRKILSNIQYMAPKTQKNSYIRKRNHLWLFHTILTFLPSLLRHETKQANEFTDEIPRNPITRTKGKVVALPYDRSEKPNRRPCRIHRTKLFVLLFVSKIVGFFFSKTNNNHPVPSIPPPTSNPIHTY